MTLWVVNWLRAFGLTLVVELPIAAPLLAAVEPHLARRMAVIALANLATHPLVWFLFPGLALGHGARLAFNPADLSDRDAHRREAACLHASAEASELPRERPPDLALLASVKSLDAKRVRAALEQTFGFRKTHDLPVTLPEPPALWAGPYAAMALEDELRWSTLADVTAAASAFLDPILSGGLDAPWKPERWTW